MKLVLSMMFTLLSLLPLCGCGGRAAASSKPTEIGGAIEIQIAVVVDGFKKDQPITIGEWHVAASCVLPVRSKGGPGHVIANNDGMVTELRWSDVRLVQGRGIVFDDFEYVIKNRIEWDNTSWKIGGGRVHPPQSFSTDSEWELFAGPVTLGPDPNQQPDRKMTIRGRYLSKVADCKPLKLRELTGLEKRETSIEEN